MSENQEPTPTPSPTRKILALLALGLTAALAAWLLGGRTRALSEVPAEEEIAAAVAVLGSDIQSGDLVRVHPYWFTAPNEAIGRVASTARTPFAGLDPRGHTDPLHLLRFDRLWVLAAYRDRETPTAEILGVDLPVLKTLEPGPHLRLSLLQLPTDGIVYDLLAHLGDATVVRGKRRCTWDGKELRHRCHEQSWKDVWIGRKEVGDALRLCIYAEPHPANTPLRITFPGVPLDGPLVLHSGFSIEGARRTDGADTRVRVSVGDELAAEWTEPKNDFTWRRTVLPPRSGSHDVTIEMEAPEVGWRQLCLDGAVLSEEGSRFVSASEPRGPVVIQRLDPPSP